MLRLGFWGSGSLLLLVTWSCKSAFLVKYCVRYLGTRLYKHLKTRMHLCIFLLEVRFNQFSTQKMSFEVFFRIIFRAARFCRRCNSLPFYPKWEINVNVGLGRSRWVVTQKDIMIQIISWHSSFKACWIQSINQSINQSLFALSHINYRII